MICIGICSPDGLAIRLEGHGQYSKTAGTTRSDVANMGDFDRVQGRGS